MITRKMIKIHDNTETYNKELGARSFYQLENHVFIIDLPLDGWRCSQCIKMGCGIYIILTI